MPETIETLRKAGINFWMLTGDKQNTALQIALSCNFISSGYFQYFMPLIILIGQKIYGPRKQTRNFFLFPEERKLFMLYLHLHACVGCFFSMYNILSMRKFYLNLCFFSLLLTFVLEGIILDTYIPISKVVAFH